MRANSCISNASIRANRAGVGGGCERLRHTKCRSHSECVGHDIRRSRRKFGGDGEIEGWPRICISRPPMTTAAARATQLGGLALAVTLAVGTPARPRAATYPLDL